ncbi:MAG: hypothetical protein EOP38_16180 [Rubrivivax sp.]|nr:MAG: hypothetical protein EOP38_16180 [Rubrivivax sp.]
MQTPIHKATLAGLLVAASFLASNPAWADKATIKANLGAARERVVALVNGKAPAATLKPEIATYSAKVDAEADSVPGFKPIWEQFKTNRDTKIIPAFDGSQPDGQDAAKALAMGEQKQLYEQMTHLLD